MDPEVFPRSGSNVPDPDPAKNERADKKIISNFRPVNFGLCVLTVL